MIGSALSACGALIPAADTTCGELRSLDGWERAARWFVADRRMTDAQDSDDALATRVERAYRSACSHAVNDFRPFRDVARTLRVDARTAPELRQ